MKLLDENTISVDDDARVEAVRSAVASFNGVSLERIDSLAGRVLMAPLVDNVMDYFKGVLVGLYKEGGTVPTSMTANLASSMNGPDNADCSKAIQTVLKQFPEAISVHIQSLPKHPAVSWALDEACRRLMVLYVSIVVLLRPVTEVSRLRAAADMTALELMISGMQATPSASTRGPHDHSMDGASTVDPIKAEFKALRRLLFEERVIISGAAARVGANSSGVKAPVAETVLGLPYVCGMRPSTLLGYLMSCGPTQV